MSAAVQSRPDHGFPAVLSGLRLLQPASTSLTQQSLGLGQRCDTDVPFMAEHPADTYSLHSDQLHVSVLITLGT